MDEKKAPAIFAGAFPQFSSLNCLNRLVPKEEALSKRRCRRTILPLVLALPILDRNKGPFNGTGINLPWAINTLRWRLMHFHPMANPAR